MLKRYLTHEKIKLDGWLLHYASTLVVFLNVGLWKQEPQIIKNIKHLLWEVNFGDEDKCIEWSFMYIKGSQFVHFFNGYSQTNMHELR